MSPLRAFACILAALLIAATAHAGDVRLKESKVTVRASTAWPSNLNKGYYPIVVEVFNEDERAHEIDLIARCAVWNSRREVRRSVSLDAQANARLELVVPLANENWNMYQIEIEVDGGEHGSVGDVGAGDDMNGGFQAVLAIVPRALPAGTVERWIADVSTLSLGGSHTTTTSTPANDDVQIAAVVFDQLPASYAAYTSLDLVALDTRAGLPPPDKLEPLLAWVRLGGTLALLGDDAAELAAGSPALASWLEPRFRTVQARTNAYAFGMGLLALDASGGEFLESSEHRELVRNFAQGRLGTVPDPSGGRIGGNPPRIPDLGQVPMRTFAALLILFAVLIGPVNFIAVRRRNKPLLLLITIPAIALASSLALLAYGIFFQGLDVKSATRTLALLDQRSHRSVCIEERQMYAGLAPAAGLRPGPGTTVIAIGATAANQSEAALYLIEEDQGRLLSGDYLPARVAIEQVLLHDQAARGRVNVTRTAGGFAIENALETSIESLVLRDTGERYFGTSSTLKPGERVELEALDAGGGSRVFGAFLRDGVAQVWSGRYSSALTTTIPEACYAARLSGAAFRDDCGVATTERLSEHVLVGVLPLDAEYWR